MVDFNVKVRDTKSMKTSKTVFICLMSLSLIAAKPAGSDTTTIPYHIYNAATQFGVDVSLMYALCQVESNCKAKAINHNDANKALKEAGITVKSYGMFQIQVPTAVGLGFIAEEHVTVEKMRRGKLVKISKVVDHSRDLLKPEINSWYAAKLLAKHYKRYGTWAKAISAYNAGSYTRGNKEYVSKVLTNYAKLKLDRRF